VQAVASTAAPRSTDGGVLRADPPFQLQGDIQSDSCQGGTVGSLTNGGADLRRKVHVLDGCAVLIDCAVLNDRVTVLAVLASYLVGGVVGDAWNEEERKPHPLPLKRPL
jgi:hypothetical protein